MLRIFIGFDYSEPIAYHVLSHSILRRAGGPISITPLALNTLNGTYTRPRGKTESTEFSLTRFLVPYLCWYQGLAVYMDCDMLCLTDLYDLLSPSVLTGLCDNHAVSVCQHEYTPSAITKFHGHRQTAYPRKNWSSFMVFNNERCRELTADYVNSATGMQLHRFQWCKEQEIGALPWTWNWLVGEYPPNPDAKILHYTNGGPWHPGYEACDHADVWIKEFTCLTTSSQKLATVS